ncbi:SNF2 family helicase, putative [Talaromyces marneffei ATCC 18224]|uniref:SNF2 family helicase, putative n=1 Tax=Talaromyces marneffei (strain ATCC 18224 / CBS 334.59 / QM 7333) TaxID=441960 RepID=B6Q3K1_TALMQ|nr:SNF2 family helicase, putative [Talaromyces marneffei ATCC 18224]
MSRPMTRGCAAKRKSSKTDIDNFDQEEQLNRASVDEVDQVVQQDDEVQLRETRHEATPKTNTNVNHRQVTRKRQKVEQSAPPTASEFVEIEYVSQLRHNFSPKKGLAGDLPPIHDLKQIFEQITLHSIQEDGFKGFIQSLNGRQLRVATVCSGTESPILALEMVVSELKKLNIPFSFKHLFSAEIVEYKQAYIERNFRPPLLFRDAIELHREFAYTAYGAKRKVPTRPDLLVAGFPCVDYSNLNNWRKKFGERGESNDTLRGLLAYCEIHRPKIIILENITNAPWAAIGRAFEKVGYCFRHVKVDTKDFYLPQTRERGYALCVEKSLVSNGDKMLNEWVSVFSGFGRRASSPFTEFIDADDDVIEQRKLERPPVAEPRSSPIWSLYKIRHADVRRATTFGNGRPITHWEEGGKCCPATWMDLPWFFSQVERVWDTIDVNHLRTLAVGGYDNTYKIRCIDVSQGVDRDMDTKPFGIMGCITPCGMLYSTARGGQVQGRELLSMQGLPLNRLSLTRESQSQMQDLAGNAMSTTVVGPAIIAALTVCHSVLRVENEEQQMIDIDDHIEESMPAVSLMSSYLTNMKTVASWDKTRVGWLPYIQASAGLTASLCSCEGPYGIGRYGLYRCMDCGFTACAACKVNPVHNYNSIPVSQLRARRDPKVFREMLLYSLPALIQPPPLPMNLYRTMLDQYSTTPETTKIWKQYLETVTFVCQDTLMFKSIKRRHIWTVVYEGANSTLQLTINAQGMHWKLFAKAPNDEPARSYFREVVRHPIARMKVLQHGSSLLDGEWQICGPLSRKDKTIYLQGTGDLLPSYENMCGLPDSAQKKVWSGILVGALDEAIKGLSLDIRGYYERIPSCGGALQSLHRRISQETKKPDLFLFLDPRTLGPSQLDSWVFSTDPRRKTDDSQRDILLQLDSKWSYQDLLHLGGSTVLASHRKWIDVGIMSLVDRDSENGFASRILSSQITFQLNSQSCYDCYLPLLAACADVTGTPEEQHSWEVVETSNLQGMNEFAWTWARFSAWSPCENWKPVDIDFEICGRCFPEQPKMAWAILRGKERPTEDPADAARCERDYKLRPSPFYLFGKLDSLKDGENKQRRHKCVALNVKTMFHRACGAIAHRQDDSTAVDFYWRIGSNDDTDIPRPGSYRILNNNGEPGAAQPPQFKILMRPDQLRSLRWVLSRESDQQVAFPEEEVEEAILAPLNWRAEAKVVVHRKIRGGILADHVGFGKTAVILGLIDCQHEKDVLESEEPCNNGIPLKATCIVVPDILFDQWRGEIGRFLGEKYTVLEIDNILTLNSTPVKALKSADIVLVSWTTFTGALYFKRLEEVAGGPCPPKTNSSVRMFEAWSEDVLGSVETQVSALQNGGPEAFLSAIDRKRSSIWGIDAYNRYLSSRKLAGKRGGKFKPDDDPLIAGQAAEDIPETSVPRLSEETAHGSCKDTLPKEKAESQNETNQKVLDRSAFGIPKTKQTSVEDVRNTVFHMYRFQRLVIDEFTYLNQDRHALLASLKARSRWIMSGTPPIKGFASAERMARLLNVYLGRPSDEDYEKSKYKRSFSDQTETENFHFFREVPSRGWQFRRNGLAQHFCDVFMRQNTPDIPPIKWTVHYHPAVLSAVERVLYLELKLFYESYNPNTTGEKREKYSHDQRGRVSEIVDSCDSPEQSLIKRSSYYDDLPRWSTTDERIDTALKFMKHRRREAVKVLSELTIQAKAIAWLLHQLGQSDPRFDALKASFDSNDCGDTDVSIKAHNLIDEALKSYQEGDWKQFWHSPNGRSVKIVSGMTDIDCDETEEDEEIADEEEVARGDNVDANNEYVPLSQREKRTTQHKKTDLRPLPNDKSEQEKELREWTNRYRVNVLALVERIRALRFAESAYAFQDWSAIPDCQSCERNNSRTRKEHNVLGKCGHIVCTSCLNNVLSDNKCTVGDCRAAVDKQYVIPGSHFAMCRSINIPTPSGGTKVDALVGLLKDESLIPKEDQVILFLQFPDLEETVTAAFQLHNISYVSVGTTGRRGRNRIKTFAGHDKKVAILHLGTENAAGLNLQNANHVIFFAPFAAKSHYEYQSTITQSSGRVIRFGQKKEVHIWNLVTLNTLEVGILQGQDGRVLVRRASGEYELVLEDEVKVNDVKGFEVPVFDWK